MQCLRCSYIQFKSTPKCANCGYDFKKLKSSALVEAENVFTIFATVGAGAAFSDTSHETGFQQDSPSGDMEGMDNGMDASELYNSPEDALADLNTAHVDEFGDFKLDLTETNEPDSESWNIGATLTEDLSATTNPVSEDFMKEADLETGDFEVQGLGFDFNDDLAQADAAESTDAPTADEESPETNEFFLPDPVENSADDANEISLETEATGTDLESEAEPEYDSPIGLNIPEIELDSTPDIELGSTPEITIEQSPEVEPGPAPEVESDPVPELEGLQLDLDTVSLEVEPVQEDQPKAPDTPLEGLELEMDPDEESPSDR